MFSKNKCFHPCFISSDSHWVTMVATTTEPVGYGQPKLFKKHTDEEAAILKEYIRISNREGLVWSQRIAYLLFDSRTNLAFAIHVSCFLFTLYLSGSTALLNVDVLDVLSTYLFADLLSGIVHIYLDHSKVAFDGSYADFARMGFQVHHLYPTFPWMMDPHFQPYMECNTIFGYANFVALVNALTLNLPAVPLGCVMVVSFQATHYYAHAKTHGKAIPQWVSTFQDLGIIISPRGHQVHHTMYTTDFCIFNGYMNDVCDWIMSDERRVEQFIETIDLYPGYVVLLVVNLIVAGLMFISSLRWVWHSMCYIIGIPTSVLPVLMASVLAIHHYGRSATKV